MNTVEQYHTPDTVLNLQGFCSREAMTIKEILARTNNTAFVQAKTPDGNVYIPVPEGYVAVGHRTPKDGELYIGHDSESGFGVFCRYDAAKCELFEGEAMILEKKGSEC